jgi:hypothetical protein
MQPLPAQDRHVYITVGPSCGRPDFDRMAELSSTVFTVADEQQGRPVNVVQLVVDAFFYPNMARVALLGAVARWLAHWVIFRGGWSVYIDAPDRDPSKIRCASREEAQARAGRLAAEIQAHGPGVVDESLQ